MVMMVIIMYMVAMDNNTIATNKYMMTVVMISIVKSFVGGRLWKARVWTPVGSDQVLKIGSDGQGRGVSNDAFSESQCNVSIYLTTLSALL